MRENTGAGADERGCGGIPRACAPYDSNGGALHIRTVKKGTTLLTHFTLQQLQARFRDCPAATCNAQAGGKPFAVTRHFTGSADLRALAAQIAREQAERETVCPPTR